MTSSYLFGRDFNIDARALSFSNEETKTVVLTMTKPVVKLTPLDNIAVFYTVSGGTVTVKTSVPYTGTINLLALEPR
jgi:hypothetical protein